MPGDFGISGLGPDFVDRPQALWPTLKSRKTYDWAVNDCYLFPGPIQYFGPTEVCDAPTVTLALEKAEGCCCCCECGE